MTSTEEKIKEGFEIMQSIMASRGSEIIAEMRIAAISCLSSLTTMVKNTTETINKMGYYKEVEHDNGS